MFTPPNKLINQTNRSRNRCCDPYHAMLLQLTVPMYGQLHPPSMTYMYCNSCRVSYSLLQGLSSHAGSASLLQGLSSHVGSAKASVKDLAPMRGQLQPPSRSKLPCRGSYSLLQGLSSHAGSAIASFKDLAPMQGQL